MSEKAKPGRPRKPNAKVAVTLRLEPATVAAYQARGETWRSEMEAALAEAVKPKPVALVVAPKPVAPKTATKPAAEPAPKFKSRLKGEWKAP